MFWIRGLKIREGKKETNGDLEYEAVVRDKISIVMKSQATYKAFCTASLMWDFITVYNPIRLFLCKPEDAVLKKKKKSWRNRMQLIKDMQFEFTHASIMGSCAPTGRERRLLGMEGGASFSTAKAFSSQPSSWDTQPLSMRTIKIAVDTVLEKVDKAGWQWSYWWWGKWMSLM